MRYALTDFPVLFKALRNGPRRVSLNRAKPERCPSGLGVRTPSLDASFLQLTSRPEMLSVNG